MNGYIDPQYLGYRLLNRGFRDWFLYMFQVINGQPFILEPLHEELFEINDKIISGDLSRVCENMSPRTGKTTNAQWLCVYAILKNPKAQIIYTSFNQELLKQVSNNIAQIMNHPIFKAMYPILYHRDFEEIESNPVDDFWREYILSQTGKPTFSSRKITTSQGGVILFNSIGSAVTGFGAGIRGRKGFTGILIMDDPDKPTEIRSDKIREKTHVYFAETLLSRLNNSDTPILNIQQRLHVDDMSGFLIETYGFYQFKFPLVADDGTCNIPSQYSPERIKELQVNNYVFQSQYQQEPIILGGGVFKREWWRYYADANDARYRRLFITADTANKTKEWNDFTAIGVWGFTANRRLRLLDMVHAKMEIPELQSTLVALWEKWKNGIGPARCTTILIEDKASGTQVIQQLQRKGGLPIKPFVPDKDKLERAYDAIPQIAAGNVELPENDQNPISKEFLAEADAFSADFSHKHDDMIDMMTMAVSEAFSSGGYF